MKKIITLASPNISDDCIVQINGEHYGAKVIYKYKTVWQFIKGLFHKDFHLKYRTNTLELDKSFNIALKVTECVSSH